MEHGTQGDRSASAEERRDGGEPMQSVDVGTNTGRTKKGGRSAKATAPATPSDVAPEDASAPKTLAFDPRDLLDDACPRPLTERRSLLWSSRRDHVHHTGCGVVLFVRAVFAALPERWDPESRADRLTPILFALGGIEAAAEFGHLARRAQRKLERSLLRDSFGAGPIEMWRLRRELARRADTPMGNEALASGRRAFLLWLRGEDPAWRIQQLVQPVRSTRPARKPYRASAPSRRNGAPPIRDQRS